LTRERISISDLLPEIENKLSDNESVLSVASQKGVPIICPAFLNPIAGFHVWLYGQDRKTRIDPFLDVRKIVERMYEDKKVGIIILGRGVPKHFVLFANTFRDGVDSAIQITMDRPELGGLSGTTVEEAVSWGKLNPTEGR